MIEDQYSVNIYFLVVFDINLDDTLCSLLARGFALSQRSFLFSFKVNVQTTISINRVKIQVN